ncbi:MAG: ABC transporter permease, partial [Prevotellaceae bacterium]|nr:ABC transporter permease [Prevotellaceae bacterium]
MKELQKLGEYTLLMIKVFAIPDSWKMFFRQVVKEAEKQGIGSVGIVFIISIFIGSVITLQMQMNTDSAFIPGYATGLATRDTLLLEFSSTIMCLILAGKVGSNIASEIGTMRITEQIDAMDIMGVNSANYLILPKIVAFVLVIPCLVIISMFFGIFGGYLIAYFTDVITVPNYIYGIQYAFVPYYITYSVIKAMVFAYLIVSITAYYGYNVRGGALEVGKASTSGVVVSSVMILMFNLILTKL